MTGSDKLLLISSNVSRQAASVIVQNVSSSPILLNPSSSIGFLIIRPEPLYVPRFLPILIHNVPIRHFSTEGLRSKSRKVENEIMFLPSGNFSSDLYEGFTNLTNQIKPTIYQAHQIVQFKSFPGENENFDLQSISLRCIKQKDSCKNLIPVRVHIKSLWQKTGSLELNILPWDSSLTPPHSLLCSTCKLTHGLHFPSHCPSLEQCSFCSQNESLHSRGDCSNMDFCWNCEGDHYWRSCPLPILNKQQKELTQYGFMFKKVEDVTRITYRYSPDEEQEVLTRSEAVEKLLNHWRQVSSAWKGTFLVGYNVFMIMAVISDLVDNQKPNKDVRFDFFKNIRGLIDVKWLFPGSLEDKSLAGLCSALDIHYLEKKTLKPTAELKFVDRAITEILREELNLSLYSDISLLCKNYSVKVFKSDLKGISRKHIISEKVLFKKLRTNEVAVESSEEESDDDDENELIKNYVDFREKKAVHHIHQLEMRDEDKKEFILSVKTFEVGGQRYLNSLCLGTITGKILLNFEAIIPSCFYNKIPDGVHGRLCPTCSDSRTPTLHSSEDCPTRDICTIHAAQVKQHKRLECREERCWNCGEDHNWRRCQETILTETQQYIAAVGYKTGALSHTGVRMFTFAKDVENIEVSVECEREDKVYERLIGVLESSKREHRKNVLVGFNIAEQLQDLMECCESSSYSKEEIINHIHSICEVQSMPQYERETRGLHKILERDQIIIKNSKLKQTLEVVRSISKLLIDINKNTASGRRKATVKFSEGNCKTLATKKLNIVAPNSSISQLILEDKAAKNTEEFSLVVVVYLDHVDDVIKTLEITVYEPENKIIYEGSVMKVEKDRDEKELRYLIRSMADKILLEHRKNPRITIITPCPESFRVFEQYFRETVKRSSDIFDQWFCIRQALSRLNHPFTKLPTHAIIFDKDVVDKIETKVLKETTKHSRTKKMFKIYKFLQKKDVEAQCIKIKESLSKAIVFFDITFKSGDFCDDYGCPLIQKICFKFLESSVRVCEKVDVFLSLISSLRNHKKVIFIGLNEASLEGLLQIGFFNHEVFEHFTLGVNTITELVKNHGISGDIQDYLRSHGGVEESSELILTMEKVFNQLGASDSFPLTSHFVNKLLLNSPLQIFSEKFVLLKINRKTWNPGKNVFDAELLRTFWNIDSEQFIVKLNVISYSNPLFEKLVVPAQSSLIDVDKQKNIRVVAVNKSKQTIVRMPINNQQSGIIFGIIELLEKQKEETAVTGFEELKEDFYNRWPDRLKKKKVLEEMVTSFKRLGYSTYQEALTSVLNKSCSVQKLIANLHSFVVNDFCNSCEVSELMLSRLYNQFVSTQQSKEKYPEYSCLLEKKYPQDWLIRSTVDGESVEFQFAYSRVSLEERREEEAEIITVDQG